jgi:hypothetical protein
MPLLKRKLLIKNNLEAMVGLGHFPLRLQPQKCLILQGIQADCVTIGTPGFHLVC